MSEITIKKENLQKAYYEGCDDVKETLKRMFPDVLGPIVCCDGFKKCLAEGVIKEGDSDYTMGTDGWWIKHCPFCDAEYKDKKFSKDDDLPF